MATTNFKLNGIKGRVVGEGKSQNFTCELVILRDGLGGAMIAVVSFGALKKQTAAVFPLDGIVIDTTAYCDEICHFYETFRADIWSDLYKDANHAL